MILPDSSWTFAPGFAGAKQFEHFRAGLLSLLAPATVDTLDFEGHWNSSGRFRQVNGSLAQYLPEVYFNLVTWYQWYNLGKPWFEDYAKMNDGRQPFVDPSPSVRWAYARNNMTEADFERSTAKKAVFKEFIDTSVLVKDEKTCSSAIYVMPFGLGTAAYRVGYFVTLERRMLISRTSIKRPLGCRKVLTSMHSSRASPSS